MNLPPVLPLDPSTSVRTQAEPPRRKIAEPPAVTAPEAPAVREVVERAAAEMFSGQSVEVDSFFDEKAARMVYRVADRYTGQVLIETPPEDLLRFYATSRAGEGASAPLLAVEA